MSSLWGLINENKNDIAIESTCAFWINSTKELRDSLDISSSIRPVWSTLSDIPKRNSQGTSAGARSILRLYKSDLFWRPISNTSSNPMVVINAVLLPLDSRRAFVATVEPWTNWAFSTPVSLIPWLTAIDGSEGVEGSL